jgi:hypothetical protein
MSQLVSEHYRYNTSCTVLFSKTYGEDTLRCPYKYYSSLNRWQANRDLLSTFTLCNLLSITIDLWQGKYPPIGWCESRTRPLKMRFAWGQSLSCGRGYMSVVWLVMTVHLGLGDLGMSCSLFLKTWIHSYNVYNVVHVVLNTWVSLEG